MIARIQDVLMNKIKSSNVLIVLSCVFAVFLFILAADAVTFQDFSVNSTISYLIFSALLFVIGALAPRYIAIPIYFMFMLVPAFHLGYYFIYDAAIDQYIVGVLLTTNALEVSEFLTAARLAKYLAVVIVMIVVLAIASAVLYRLSKRLKLKKKFSVEILLALVFAAAIVWYQDPRLLKGIYLSYKKFYSDLSSLKKITAKRQHTRQNLYASKSRSGETYVVVIGEALNKQHMGIYGYLRDTTPELQKHRDLLVFDNAYAIHHHTHIVLPLSFTEANLYNELNYYDAHSLFSILKNAGFKTYWLTNQFYLGVEDHAPVDVMAKSTVDHLQRFSAKLVDHSHALRNYDGAMLPSIEKILNNKATHNRVIFVHLYGSHYQFCNRYPRKFHRFEGKLDKAFYGNIANAPYYEKINCYDNSVLYQDFVLASILKILKEVDGVSGFIFFSDHGEDVFLNITRNLGTISYNMLDIPMLMWFSESYRQKYPQRYEVIDRANNKLFSNDLIYDTLVGLFAIQTEKYTARFDLSSPKYNLPDHEALTLKAQQSADKNYRSMIKYARAENDAYQQYRNIHQLKKDNLLKRVIPSTINSVGNLKEIWRDGYRSFEVDVYYKERRDCFVVGHGVDTGGNMCFVDFISHIDSKQVAKIWLDVKNIPSSDVNKIIARLKHVEETTGLQKELIVESRIRADYFNLISKSGYHTSYYLPATPINRALKKNDQTKLKSLANSITSQVVRQQVHAVSFVEDLYPFVEKFLQELLPKHIVFHTWKGEVGGRLYLTEENFIKNLKGREYYTNERVKTILVHYKSRFFLF